MVWVQHFSSQLVIRSSSRFPCCSAWKWKRAHQKVHSAKSHWAFGKFRLGPKVKYFPENWELLAIFCRTVGGRAGISQSSSLFIRVRMVTVHDFQEFTGVYFPHFIPPLLHLQQQRLIVIVLLICFIFCPPLPPGKKTCDSELSVCCFMFPHFLVFPLYFGQSQSPPKLVTST